MNLIILKSIMDTLGNVEVHGKDNMLRMIACMNAIEQLTQEAAQSTPDQPEEAPEPECQAEPSENE